MAPILFVFSGLPGSGKSTLAQSVARKYQATYLRIDTVEQGLRDLCGLDVQGEGYELSYRIAGDQLNLGLCVVADSCNPIALTREKWEEVARHHHSVCVSIEVLCSDRKEHRRRVETRTAEVENLRLPTWAEVESREYYPWQQARIRIDTAHQTIEESRKELEQQLEETL